MIRYSLITLLCTLVCCACDNSDPEIEVHQSKILLKSFCLGKEFHIHQFERSGPRNNQENFIASTDKNGIFESFQTNHTKAFYMEVNLYSIENKKASSRIAFDSASDKSKPRGYLWMDLPFMVSLSYEQCVKNALYVMDENSPARLLLIETKGGKLFIFGKFIYPESFSYMKTQP